MNKIIKLHFYFSTLCGVISVLILTYYILFNLVMNFFFHTFIQLTLINLVLVFICTIAFVDTEDLR